MTNSEFEEAKRRYVFEGTSIEEVCPKPEAPKSDRKAWEGYYGSILCLMWEKAIMSDLNDAVDSWAISAEGGINVN